MAYAFVEGYGGGVIVAPCLVAFLKEVAASGLNVTNQGEVGNLAHQREGWTNSDHNPFIQHAGKSYVRAADFGGPDYPVLIDFWNWKYKLKDPRVYPYGYTNSNLPAPRGLTIWFGGGRTSAGTDGDHAHLSVTQADGNNASANGWVPALDDTSPWGLADWLHGGRSTAPEEEDDLPFSEAQLKQIIHDQIIGVLRAPEVSTIIHNAAKLAVRELAAPVDPSTKGTGELWGRIGQLILLHVPGAK